MLKKVEKLSDKKLENVKIMFEAVCVTGNRKLNMRVRKAAAVGAKTGVSEERIEFHDIYQKTLLYASHYDFDSYLLYLEKK